MDKKVIVSMTTIPGRKDRLEQNLDAILNQSYLFDTLVINVDDNLTDEDYAYYDELATTDSRIVINKAKAKWRSCNKLLPTIKLYPDDIIITVDDDIYYPVNCFKYLVEQYEKTPDCVIAHEVNPISVDNDGFINFYNAYDVKLMQRQFGKYLSNCCLFPPHIFDGTDLYDYDKMMHCTNGTHDELWFWVNSLSNGIMTVVFSFALETLRPYTAGEYQLTNFNNTQEKINDYMVKINEMYGEKMLKTINSNEVVFTINKDNIYAFIALYNQIRNIYPQGFRIVFDDLTKNWKAFLTDFINK